MKYRLIPQKYKGSSESTMNNNMQTNDNLEVMDKFLETQNIPRLNHEETENLNGPITMNKDDKILNKIPANQIQQYIKRIIHHDQIRCIQGMQGWFTTHKSIQVIHNINKMKDKNHNYLNRCRKSI